MSQQTIWLQIYERLTFKQYTQIADSYGRATDGLPSLRYETYFIRTLKYTRSKSLRDLANQGLNLCKGARNE